MPGVDLVTFDRSSDLFAAWHRTKQLVYLQPRPDDDSVERSRGRVIPGRFVAAVDDGAVVGTYRSWQTHVTVPGGAAVPADAVSGVAVLPTHRRRGILTRMISEDLALAHEQELPVAVLISAEASIYGRYGFGPATEASRWTVDGRAASIAPDVRTAGSVRVVDEAELRALAPAVHEAARRPGEIDHPDQWWDRDFGIDAEPDRVPRTGLLHVGADGTPDGFATFRADDIWVDHVYDSVLHLERLQATTDEAYTGLWSVLAGIDTVARIEAPDLAVDEPLPWLLTDRRAARQVSRTDFQWSRLLDPAAALSARRYESPGAVVVEVADARGWASGRYLLEADEGGAGSCCRTSRSADLTVPVAVLSAAWLGSATLPAAVVAGRVDEHVPGAAGRLNRLLATARAPWTPTEF
jgi:predicted acetyltransferase